jgi:hypothetical protein
MKRLRDMLAKALPVGGSASLQTSDTTNQTAAIRQAAEAYGQRGVFLSIGTGGSKVSPSYDGGSGGNTLLIVAALAGGLVLMTLFRRKKK